MDTIKLTKAVALVRDTGIDYSYTMLEAIKGLKAWYKGRKKTTIKVGEHTMDIVNECPFCIIAALKRNELVKIDNGLTLSSKCYYCPWSLAGNGETTCMDYKTEMILEAKYEPPKAMSWSSADLRGCRWNAEWNALRISMLTEWSALIKQAIKVIKKEQQNVY